MSDNSIAGTICAEQRVFFVHPTKGWSVGTVQALYADVGGTVPLNAVTANNAASLKLAMIVDEATGNTERVLVNTTSSSSAGGKNGNGNSGVDSVIHPFMEGAYNPNDHELFRVNDLHISTLLYCLKERYERLQLQYSWLGETIISVNPFAMMPFNGAAAQQRYLTALRQGGAMGGNSGAGAAAPASGGGPVDPATGLPVSGPLPPHVWHIAEKAFSGAVVRGDGNQSVVISGESGSGKTENTKAIIDFLGQLSALHSCNAVQKQLADTVSGLIKACNPILESFGNAKTVRNDNSSRFGKYTKLFFNKDSGVIVGGGMVTYLLEKSRIVIQGPKERNYHVFYELLDACNAAGAPPSGLSPALIAQLHLQGKRPSDFAILVGGTATNRINKDEPQTRKGTNGAVVSDAKEFQHILSAMQQMQVPVGVQESIWKCVAAIMHLGEVRFLTSESNGKSMLDEASRPSLVTAATLLGLDEAGAAALLQVFLEKSRTKILTTMATQAEAEALRDAFSKALYMAIFDYLVAHINDALQVKDLGDNSNSNKAPVDVASNKSIGYVGVLDIFGFENFQTNSFEQLCINFANETLQGHYNRFTFLNDEEECKREGVPSPQVAFPDNSPCLRLFDTPKTGIFAALDEESGFRGGTSDRFTQLLWDQWAPQGGGIGGGGADPSVLDARARFGRPKGTNPTSFSVSHFAATVEYKTAGWLEKNSDTLKEEAAEATGMSSDPFVAGLLPRAVQPAGDGRGPPAKKPSVAKHFQKQLGELMAELGSTSTNFIRCIKPSMAATPQHIDNGHVGSQLESAGVVQTVALKRQGYPIRRPIESFVKSFRCLCPNAVVGRGGIGVRRGGGNTLPPPKQLSPSEQAKAILTYISTAYDWTPQGIEGRKVRLAQHLRETSKGKMDAKRIEEEVARAVPPFPYCVVGSSKVFLKPIAWAKLELLRRRYNMGRLRKCAPTLRRWVGRYRVKKAEVERRRLAELARLQQEAENRRKEQQQSVVAAAGGGANVGASKSGGGVDPLLATGLQAGLTEEKAKVFATVAHQFVHFDISILLDVIYNLPTKEAAVEALNDMQKQRLDQTLPAPMRRMLKECKVRDSVVEQLAANNVATMSDLAALQRSDLRRLGFSEAEISAVAQRMLSQQSNLVVNQRLRHEFGGATDMGDLASHAFQQQQQPRAGSSSSAAAAADANWAHAAAARTSTNAAGAGTPPQSATARRPPPPPQSSAPPRASSEAYATEAKVSSLLEMGIGDRKQCTDALNKTRGDMQHAATFLLTGGELPPSSRPSSAVRAPAGRATPPPQPQQQRAPPQHQYDDEYLYAPPPGRTTAPPPQQQRPAVPSQQQQAPMLSGYGYGNNAPVNQQWAPQQQQQRPSAPSPQQQQQQLGGGGGDITATVDQKKLGDLVSMGFGRSHAAMALLQTNGNFDKAMDILMK